MNEVIFLSIFTGWDLVLILLLAVSIAFLFRRLIDFIDETVSALPRNRNEPEEFDLESVPWNDIANETELAYCFRDGYPVTKGHLLFVPKYNTIEATEHCFTEAYNLGKRLVQDGTIDGFNVGMNNGEAAGQTIDWPHIHFIPRRTGDSKDPTGGVRLVIPSQGNYLSLKYRMPK